MIGETHDSISGPRSSPRRFDTDVLIVGAGPAGLATAIELGIRGVDCIVVEPRTGVSHRRPRGKTTHARTMEHFRRWGIGDQIREVTPTPPEVFHDVAFCTSLFGHEVHRMPNALGMYGERRDSASESGVFVGQPHVEEILRDKVASLESVRVLYGASATGDILGDLDRPTVRIEGPEDFAGIVNAQFVVVADGPRSQLRDSLGIALSGGDEGQPSVSILFEAPDLWGRVPHAPAVFYWCVGPGTSGNLAPYDPDRGLWVASTQDLNASSHPAALIEGLIGEAVQHSVLSVDVWQSRRTVAETYRRGRFFLVGDAARQTPPWGGHGYNTCVLDGIDLAWKLAAVLSGWAADALLDTFEAERRPVAEYVIDTSVRNAKVLSQNLFRAGVDANSPHGEAVRTALAGDIDRAKRPEFYSEGLVLGYSYAFSPAVVSSATQASSSQPGDVSLYQPTFDGGSRLPHAWMPDGRSLYDLLGPWFTLVADLANLDAFAISEAAADRGVPLRTIPIDVLPERLAAPALVLVRPDQHVSFSGDSLPMSSKQLWDTVTQMP